ncbi:unnamed protein product [Parnassius apollo]|uniref:(apollo) hypothetical protein n=1 Tax=Parnassius apollo TaxID=110799 RepID=A0A8S3WH53_PARAO|nr:unnamed protein product [Parnassius apollo]
MAPCRYEYNVRISGLPIDINGGLVFFEVSCVLRAICEYSVGLSEKVLISAVLDRLHHYKFTELLIGLQNVFQITQVTLSKPVKLDIQEDCASCQAIGLSNGPGGELP